MTSPELFPRSAFDAFSAFWGDRPIEEIEGTIKTVSNARKEGLTEEELADRLAEENSLSGNEEVRSAQVKSLVETYDEYSDSWDAVLGLDI